MPLKYQSTRSPPPPPSITAASGAHVLAWSLAPHMLQPGVGVPARAPLARLARRHECVGVVASAARTCGPSDRVRGAESQGELLPAVTCFLLPRRHHHQLLPGRPHHRRRDPVCVAADCDLLPAAQQAPPSTTSWTAASTAPRSCSRASSASYWQRSPAHSCTRHDPLDVQAFSRPACAVQGPAPTLGAKDHPAANAPFPVLPALICLGPSLCTCELGWPTWHGSCSRIRAHWSATIDLLQGICRTSPTCPGHHTAVLASARLPLRCSPTRTTRTRRWASRAAAT